MNKPKIVVVKEPEVLEQAPPSGEEFLIAFAPEKGFLKKTNF